MRIAQLSDTHVMARASTHPAAPARAGYLASCVADIRALEPRPDAVIHTGDMTHDGTVASYEHLAELLSPLDMPVYLAAGNRDRRDAVRAAFRGHGHLQGGDGFLHYAIDDGPVRLIALDTLRPGDRRGGLCRDRLDWLARVLDGGRGKPAVLFMHHPPFPGADDYPDSFRDRGEAEAFVGLVGRHPEIAGILCGHLHRPLDMALGGAVARTMESVAVDLSQDPDRTGCAPVYHLHETTMPAGLATARRDCASAGGDAIRGGEDEGARRCRLS